jgi:hypothetical protein
MAGLPHYAARESIAYWKSLWKYLTVGSTRGLRSRSKDWCKANPISLRRTSKAINTNNFLIDNWLPKLSNGEVMPYL